MDAEMFDRLSKLLTVAGTRRGVIGRLAATLAVAGTAPLAAEDATAGLRHRRRQRHRRNHDNRKGKRASGKQNRPRNDPPFADCTQPDSWGKPCGETIFRQTLRCCNGACPAAPICVTVNRWTSAACGAGSECSQPAARDQCCSREAECDGLEGLCLCVPAEGGEYCAFDGDCRLEGQICVCGSCH
jgi:hypothetical protein